MSITFQSLAQDGRVVNCECIEAYTMDGIWLPGHDNCSGEKVVGNPSLSLNVSNDNAHNLFQLLQIDESPYGQIAASDLLAKVAQARKLPLSEYGRKRVRTRNTVECALSVERLSFYLDQLAEIASYALERDSDVRWD